MFSTLWYIFWYLPGGESFVGTSFYLAGYILQSTDTAFGTNFSSYYSVLADFVILIFSGVAWLGNYFFHLNVVMPLVLAWLDFCLSMMIMRACLLLKGHIWSASR